MKKLFSFFLVLIIIFTVFLTGVFFIVKNEARSEKIIERLEYFANKNNIYLILNDLKYSVSFSGVKIILYNVSMKSDYMDFVSDEIKLQIDLFKIIKKQLQFRNIEIINAKIFLLDFKRKERGTENKEKSDYRFSLSSNIILKNTEIIRDTFDIKNINGNFYIKDVNFYNIAGDFDCEVENYNLNNYGKIKCFFNIDFNDSIYIKKLYIKNGITEIQAKGTKKDNTINYSLKSIIHNVSVINEYYKNDNIFISGACSLFVNGEYNIDSLPENNINNIDSFVIYPNNITVKYNNYNVLLDKSVKLIKENNDFIMSGIVSIDTFKVNTHTSVNIDKLVHKRLRLYSNNDSLNIGLYSVFYSNEKMNLSGFINSTTNIDIPFDSITNENILKYLNSIIYFDSLVFKYDTFNFALKKCKTTVKQGYAYGNIQAILGKYISVNDTFNLDLIKLRLKNKFYSHSNIEDYIKNVKGKAYSSGSIIYNLKTKKMDGLVNIEIPSLYYKSLKDTFHIIMNYIHVNDILDYDILKINIKGKYLYGTLNNIHYTKSDKLHIINGDINLEYVNLDSLFPCRKTEKKKTKRNIKIDIPKSILVKLNGECDSLIVQKEIIKNIYFDFNIKNSIICIDNAEGKMLNGKAIAKMNFNSISNQMTLNAKTEKITVNGLIKRHNLLPYNIDTKINSNTNLVFNINDIKHTIKGKIDIEAKEGWLEAPKFFKVLYLTFKGARMDTFYFDNMYGIFNVGDSCVEFNDFYMKKNGHSLIYSGWVDFNRLMTIEGNYTIDMRIADTKALESLLRKINYDSDSIIVKFKIIGGYNDPDIEITYNSLTRFLKNKTKGFINNFFNDFKDAFQ